MSQALRCATALTSGAVGRQAFSCQRILTLVTLHPSTVNKVPLANLTKFDLSGE